MLFIFLIIGHKFNIFYVFKEICLYNIVINTNVKVHVGRQVILFNYNW